MGKVITVNVHCVDGVTCVTDAHFFHKDFGSQLVINGLNLETGTQVHFSLTEKRGKPISMIGISENGIFSVDVPDNVLNSNSKRDDYEIYAFVYCTEENSGWTEHEIVIPVKMRPDKEFEQPTSEELTAFDKVTQYVSETAESIASDREQISKNKEDIEYLKKHGTGGGDSEDYKLPQATEENLGGVKASPKTDNDTVEARIGADGKLYVPAYPEQNEIPVDSALDKTSTNPVQNKAVAEAVDRLSEEIDNLLENGNGDETGNTINPLTGKKLSVLGTSISTYPNTIPEGYVSYYTAETMPSVNDMWWKKVCDSLGMTLLVNNSYSGSCVAKKSDVTIPSGSETVRNMALHDGENAPDIIIVEMGANDFLTNVSVGSYKVSNGTTFDSYSFMGAYAKMIWNIMCKYPNTKIYCATIMPLYQGTDGNPFPTAKTAGGIEAYNEIIKTVASMFGCGVIKFDKCGITTKNLINYTVDGRIHPNANGQTLMANVAKKELLKYTPVLDSYIDTSVTGDSSSGEDTGGEGGENTGEATLLHSYDFTTGEIADSVSGLAMTNTNVTLDENGAYFSKGNTALEVTNEFNPKNKTFVLEFGEVDGSNLVSTTFHKSWCVFTMGANSFRANFFRWDTDNNKWGWYSSTNEVFSFDGTVNELSNGTLKVEVDDSGNAKFYMNDVLKYEYPSLFGNSAYIGIGKTDGTFNKMTVKKFEIYSNAE